MNEHETASETTRTGAAVYLRTLADQLEGNGDVALALDDRQVRLTPTDPVTVTVAGGSDRPADDVAATGRIEVELVWRSEGTTDAEDAPDAGPVEE